MNRSNVFGRITIVTALTGLIAAANAREPTNLPPVVAVASNIGTDVICYGYQCADMLFQLMPPLFPLEVDYIPNEPPTVDHEKFCTKLYAQKPAVCSSNNIPSTPLSDPNWQPNGCGDGSIGSNAVSFIVSQGYPMTGGIGLDQPANGVNFQSACNTHDLCYGSLLGKGTCDAQFLNNMMSTCAQSINSSCTSIAVLYKYAVDTRGGDAYNNSSQDYKCAVWSAEMDNSGCRSQ